MGNTIPHGDRLHECNDNCPERSNNCGYSWCGVGRDTKHFHKSDNPQYVRAHRSENWQEFPDFYQRTLKGDLVDRGEFGFPGIGSAGLDIAFAQIGGKVIASGTESDVRSALEEHWGLSKEEMRVTVDEQDRADLLLFLPEGASPELREIVTRHLPDWYDLFESKNSSYQNESGSAFDLGIRGQYSDLHRKFMKLRKAMWDAPGEPLVGEQLPEILMDLIGHCFLTLCMLDDGSGAGEPVEGQEHQDDTWGRRPGDL